MKIERKGVLSVVRLGSSSSGVGRRESERVQSVKDTVAEVC